MVIPEGPDTSDQVTGRVPVVRHGVGPMQASGARMVASAMAAMTGLLTSGACAQRGKRAVPEAVGSFRPVQQGCFRPRYALDPWESL